MPVSKKRRKKQKPPRKPAVLTVERQERARLVGGAVFPAVRAVNAATAPDDDDEAT